MIVALAVVAALSSVQAAPAQARHTPVLLRSIAALAAGPVALLAAHTDVTIAAQAYPHRGTLEGELSLSTDEAFSNSFVTAEHAASRRAVEAAIASTLNVHEDAVTSVSLDFVAVCAAATAPSAAAAAAAAPPSSLRLLLPAAVIKPD